MGYGRYVFDGVNHKAGCLKSPNGSFSTSTRTFYENIHFPQAKIHGLFSSLLCCKLCRKRRALLGPLEAHRTTACPGNDISLTVGDGDNGVVERRFNMGNALADNSPLSPFLSRRFRQGFLYPLFGLSPTSSSSRLRFFAVPCEFAHSFAFSAHGPANPCGAAILGNTRWQ